MHACAGRTGIGASACAVRRTCVREGAKGAPIGVTKLKRDEDSIMIVRTISRFTAAVLLSLTSGIAIGAQGPIYRCAQADGTLLYADNPCDGGTLVDIHPGRADPDAKERLERAQVELNRAAADRKANEQAAAARNEELAQLRRQQEAAQSMAEPVNNASDAYYGAGFDAYGPYTQRRMQRSNFRGGGRGHRSSAKDRFHGEKRVPAVIRRTE